MGMTELEKQEAIVELATVAQFLGKKAETSEVSSLILDDRIIVSQLIFYQIKLFKSLGGPIFEPVEAGLWTQRMRELTSKMRSDELRNLAQKLCSICEKVVKHSAEGE